SLIVNGDILGDGSVVVLEPEKWIAQRFPLLRYIDIGSQLGVGSWILVLYRKDCLACQEEVSKYERQAWESWQSVWVTGTPQVALVEVPGLGEADQRADNGECSCRRGHLRNDREWLVNVPV